MLNGNGRMTDGRNSVWRNGGKSSVIAKVLQNGGKKSVLNGGKPALRRPCVGIKTMTS